jgi:multiple sugar transport system ATP-binding protein
MASVLLQDVWKKYGSVQALQGVDFEMGDGEMFCLLGPSGAGKTTTIRIISGVEKPDRGDILVEGESIVGLMPRDRDVAVAFESYALYPQLTVFDNLAFPLRAPIRRARYSKADVEKRVKEVADLLNIGELLHRLPRELSGGQRQRVGLGRALVRKPKVYLLDEPIAHLDAKLRHRMRGELKKIQTELGITTLYSTPDQLEALSMADTIAVLNLGKIEQVGSPEEVYERPANVFVAQLVGDPPMNILDATLEGGMLVVDCDVNFQFPLPPDAPPLLGRRLLVGIRPKDITLVTGNVDDAHTRGRVKDLDTLGQTTVALVAVGCLEMKVKVLTSEAPPRDSLVSLFVDTTKLYYFDSETRCRVA